MKKNLLFIPLIAMLLSGCVTSNQNNGSTIIDDPTGAGEGTYDTDPNEDVDDSGSDNDYDDIDVGEDDITEPDTYGELNGNVIEEAGNYSLEGEYSSISITAPKNSDVYVFLNGVNISSTSGIAFSSSNKINLYLVLLNGSTSTISNDYEDANAFHVKGDVHISGEGTLNVTSNQKNAIKVSKDLYISGNVVINATGANHAISARSITASDATINVRTLEGGKDGIQLECDDDLEAFSSKQGFAYLKNIKFTADTFGDAIQAESYIYIYGGTYNIVTHGVFVPYSSSNLQTYDLETDDFKYVKDGSSYKRVAKDEIWSLNSSYYALATSVKGLKVSDIESDLDDDGVDETVITTGDFDITVAHGATLTINSTDDAIHTNYGNVHLEDSNFTIDTFDDGVHADYELYVTNCHIEVNSSYEALEGGLVTIDGENTILVLYADDDGINAASDEYTGDKNIYIKNGYLRVYASGDGLDANTGLYIQGGKVIVEGPGSGNGSLDADNVYLQGGIVFACSTGGMTERTNATQVGFLYQGNTISDGVLITILDSDENELFSYTLKQECNQIIFSHPSLQVGSSYTIKVGNTTLATVTLTSTFTTIGSSQGGPGGGGPGGGGHGGHGR